MSFGFDIKPHLMMRLQSLSLGNVEYPLFTITLKTILTQSDGTCKGHMYGSNRIVQSYLYQTELFMLDKIT